MYPTAISFIGKKENWLVMVRTYFGCVGGRDRAEIGIATETREF